MSDPETLSRAYRMRAYPNATQRATLARLGGATRWFWNRALDRRSAAYRADGTKLNWVSLSRWFTELRGAPDTLWLAELPREPFNQVLRDQERAFGNFFAKRAKYPRFRRRGGRVSMRFTLDQRRADRQVQRIAGRSARVNLPGLGWLKLRRTELLAGRLRSITLHLEDGRWFASFAADGVPAAAVPAPVRDVIGIDAGLHDLLVASDGGRVPVLGALRQHLARLRRYQRHYVRQRDAAARRQGIDPAKPFPKGTRIAASHRMFRTRTSIARSHAHVGAIRRETLHRATTDLVRRAKVLCIEDLAVRGMERTMRRGFRRSVANAALGEMRRQIEYKARWYGRNVVVADRWFPSSQLCSACGYRKRDLQLSDRAWDCPACGARHDRDLNAAGNLEAYARRTLTATGMSPGSNAREEPCAAGSTRNIVPIQRRRSTNREPTMRRRASKPRRRPSGTADTGT